MIWIETLPSKLRTMFKSLFKVMSQAGNKTDETAVEELISCLNLPSGARQAVHDVWPKHLLDEAAKGPFRGAAEVFDEVEAELLEKHPELKHHSAT